MTTAAASSSAHDLYDPDAVVPQNSPLLVPKKVRPSQGDAVLIQIMDNGRRPEIAHQAGQEPLAGDSEEDSSPETDSSYDDETEDMTMSDELGARPAGRDAQSVDWKKDTVSPGRSPDFQTLARGALEALRLGDRKASIITTRYRTSCHPKRRQTTTSRLGTISQSAQLLLAWIFHITHRESRRPRRTATDPKRLS
ncbi:hypothetical protein VMCG_00262 [Cytospora schulzeri]|uniref:Uncharacterized protein n=1 Tax=Cytospora schulzeri TaxID=448051 RepID=A0A423X8I4_9PEZI|nr:hypothetical protein VMCG_00262 [Valsa malicola]